MSKSERINNLPEHPRSGVLSTEGVEEAELLQIQRRESNLYFACMNAVQQPTQRRILTALVQESGIATYETLNPYMNVGKRTIRKHAKKLEENSIIERVDSKTAQFSFSSIEARALAAHAVSCYF